MSCGPSAVERDHSVRRFAEADRTCTRCLDVGGAGIGLLLLSPLLVALALAIRLTSPGPALFRSTRIGRNARAFTLYKFRSMTDGARTSGPAITAAEDPRITPLGRTLRRLKFDELPQLLNVWEGDMSLVGPRPEDPSYVALYSREQLAILDAKPGMTSPASLCYRSEETELTGHDWEDHYVRKVMPAKLAIDGEYLRGRTPRSDVRVILQTIASLWAVTPKPDTDHRAPARPAPPHSAPGNDKPPVLIAGAFLSESTGIRFVCEDLAAGLGARGWSVTTTSGIKARSLRLADMLATVWFRRHRYAVAQIDVYSGAAFMWAEAVGASLTALRCPYVVTVHDGALPEFAGRWPGRVGRLLRSAAVVTSPSPFLQNRLRQYRPDIRIIPNGLHLDRYPARRIARARPKLVWVRAFEQCYNPVLALQVLVRLTQQFPEVELLMVGPNRGGVSAQQVLDEARRLGLEHRVTIEGAVPKDRVPHTLQKGDIFLNTTNVDNAPVVVVEAMACGLCIVSTDAGGVPDLVEDGREALLVPRADPDAMAAAVTRILIDSDLAGRLSANARQKAAAYAWERVLTQWENLLIEVARAR